MTAHGLDRSTNSLDSLIPFHPPKAIYGKTHSSVKRCFQVSRILETWKCIGLYNREIIDHDLRDLLSWRQIFCTKEIAGSRAGSYSG